MPTKTFDVNLDLMNSEYQLIDGIEVVSGDTEANVFNINLLKDYQPVNVTGNTAVIVFLKPDNTTVYQNLTLVDAAAGKFTCTLSSQTIVIPGKVRAEVILYEGTKRLTSTRFEFIVRKSLLNENTVESSNEFTALTEALGTVNQYDSRITTVEQDLAAHKADYASLLINAKYPPAPLEGVKGNDVADITRLNAIIATMSDGQSLYIPIPLKLNQPLIIDKGIRIFGTSDFANSGTVLEFDGCSGVVLRHIRATLDRVHIKGINKPADTEIDIPNRAFGTIGLKNECSTNYTSGGTKTNSVTITGFNVGYASYREGSSTWAGAYRENFNLVVEANDIGVIALDGTTHEKFYGGNIVLNPMHGIYASAANDIYNEVEFIGTTIEGNGTDPRSFAVGDYTRYGIYAGANTAIKFTNAYFEKNSMYADEGGKIIKVSCHEHFNSKSFANGAVVDIYGYAPYAVKKTFSGAMSNDFTFSNCTGVDITTDNPHVRVTSNSSGVISMISDYIFMKNILAKDIKRIKLNFRTKVNTGLDAATFGILARFTLTAQGGSSDTPNIDTSYPSAFLQPTQSGVYKNYEIECVPRIGVGYLDGEALLSSLVLKLYFSNNKTTFQADYTANNLDIEILNPVITVYSDVDFSLA